MQKFTILNCTFVLFFMLNISMRIFVYGDCNVCNAATNRACVSKNEYQACNSDGDPFGRIYECNEGYICSILGTCSQNEEIVDCNECGNCNANRTFACIDTKTFALCLGSDRPSEIRSQCTGDLICNNESDQICDTMPPTCSFRDDPTEAPTTTTTTSTTPSPETNPNAFCQAIQQDGRFPIGNNPETTCRQYVHCQLVSGTWYGPIYNCPGTTYYDRTLRRCVPEIPSTCSNRVVGLAFRNIILE